MFRFEICATKYLDDVCKLLDASGLPTSDIDAQARKDFLLAIDDNGALMGVVGLEKYASHGLLRSLAVHPKARNCGLGKELVARAESSARASGIESLYLLTTTAENFFRRLNYSLTSRSNVPREIVQTAEFAHLCPDSAVCLCKSLAWTGTDCPKQGKMG